MKFLSVVSFLFMFCAAASASISFSNPASDLKKKILHFGFVRDHNAEKQQVTLTNQSSMTQKIYSTVLGSGFSAKNNCGDELLAGSSCVWDVSYWNINPGASIGELFVQVGPEYHQVTLSAYGGSDPAEATTSH